MPRHNVFGLRLVCNSSGWCHNSRFSRATTQQIHGLLGMNINIIALQLFLSEWMALRLNVLLSHNLCYMSFTLTFSPSCHHDSFSQRLQCMPHESLLILTLLHDHAKPLQHLEAFVFVTYTTSKTKA